MLQTKFKKVLTAIRRIIRAQLKVFVVLSAAVLVIAISRAEPERVGDKFQVLLPVAALGCAIAEGRGVQFFGRYVLLEIGIKGPKHLLGDVPINQRPNGGLQGFPSGHTSAATFGAVALVNSCLSGSKAAQGGALLAAGFTGSSRIEAEKHTIWQVLAGALWGWFVSSAALGFWDRGSARVGSSIKLWASAGRQAVKRFIERFQKQDRP